MGKGKLLRRERAKEQERRTAALAAAWEARLSEEQRLELVEADILRQAARRRAGEEEDLRYARLRAQRRLEAERAAAQSQDLALTNGPSRQAGRKRPDPLQETRDSIIAKEQSEAERAERRRQAEVAERAGRRRLSPDLVLTYDPSQNLGDPG